MDCTHVYGGGGSAGLQSKVLGTEVAGVQADTQYSWQ